ncbi:MAG: acylphosphatase [Methylophaga sp.]|nr:acylphosphatase [Methylophaga sp.]
MEKQQYHLLIEGSVQGVGFRAATQRVAHKLNLSGWVRNLADGRVEIMAEGTVEALESLLQWANQGPRFAKVSDISLQSSAATHQFTGFEINADGD